MFTKMQTEVTTICVTLVTFLVLNTTGSVAESAIENYNFQVVPCSSPTYDVILRASPATETTYKSKLQCALSCGENAECNFAIFRQSTNVCQHIFTYEGKPSAPSPGFINENDCFVLQKDDKPVCQNGGNFPGSNLCQCPEEFHGRECEEAIPSFCNSNLWREATLADMQTLSDSDLEIKVLTSQAHTTQISNVNMFVNSSDYVRFQWLNFLSVNTPEENFEDELKREFNLVTLYNGIWTTSKLTMTGEETISSIEDSSYTLLIRDAVDDRRLVYETNVIGNLTDLTGKLYDGHRFIMRNPSRTEFDRDTGDVVIQTPRSSVSSGNRNFVRPLFYNNRKISITYDKRYYLRWYIQSGTQRKNDTRYKPTAAELDRCWKKMSLNLEQKDTLASLREFILSLGREIRLIMAASIATDVTMVTITDSEVVVSLADYLTPTDGFTAFGTSSRIRFSSVSLSKTLVECEMTFQKSTVHNINTDQYPSSLEWVVSSRAWVMTFVITSTDTIISGSHKDVYFAAQRGKSIRVCIEMTVYTSVCFTGTTLNLDDTSNHVMVQSSPTLGVGLNPDRTFSGVIDPDCRRTAYLVSTKGWVNSATYVIGVADTPDAIASVNFIKITWFCQD